MSKHVTAILSECGLREWPAGVPVEQREFYLQRGSAIHKATALLDKGTLDWSKLDDRILPYVRAYERFRKEMGGTVIATELQIENKALGYVGTLDVIIKGCALYPSGNVLFDKKTTQADVFTRLQTTGYVLGQKKKLKRGFIALRSDGTYRAGIYDNDASDKVAWIACVKLANWKERNNV